MKKSVKKIFIVITMIALMLCCGVTTQAKAKKLKVNAVYTNAKKVRGTTRLKKAKVVAKVGKKTYKTRSNRKGKYTIKIKKKRKKGTKIKVTVYRKKKVYAKKNVKVKAVPWYMKKPFKGHKAAIGGTGESLGKVPNQYDKEFTFYVKKGYQAIFTYGKYHHSEGGINTGKSGNGQAFDSLTSKGKDGVAVGNRKIKIKVYRHEDNKLVDSYSITPRKIKQPGKTDEINYTQFLKDYEKVKKTGKEIDRSIGDYSYHIDILGRYGVCYTIGHPGYYYDVSANGVHVKITALHGATLYITVGAKASFNFSEPSPDKYDVMIKPGKTYKWEGADFKEGELIDNNLCRKVYAYKNGKLVYMAANIDYLIQGFSDNDKWIIVN